MGEKRRITDDQQIVQGANSRFQKAVKAFEAADDRFPQTAFDGTAAELREAIKSLYIAAENITELLVYRKLMGVD